MSDSIKVIVFDLDGTLYEDTHHFKYYAERIMEKLPPESQSSFIREYENIIAGNHPMKVGRVYDAREDNILVQNNGYILEAYTWNGMALSSEAINQLYPMPIEIEMKRFINIGDLWWVPGSLGLHYGLDRSITYSCFLETREYMMSPDFVMIPVEGLKNTLEKLHLRTKLVLLTNSPQPDSETILRKLGLQDVFHKIIFQGLKPTMTVQRFEEIRKEFNVDFINILSVGDNYVNEILPVKRLGCKTIYIDTHSIGGKDCANWVMGNITQAINVITTLFS